MNKTLPLFILLALCVSTLHATSSKLVPGWNAMNPDIPGLDGKVYALAFKDGSLYIAGDFKTAGNVPVKGIARWDGTEWSAIGEWIKGDAWSLAFDNVGNLYAGGYFTFQTLKGLRYSGVGKWDGKTWSMLGEEVDGYVNALTVDAAGNLYAGGSFRKAGGVACTSVAKWDGSSWSPLGTGITGSVNALLLGPTGDLFAGGEFATAGGVPASNVAKWDGNAWSSLGSGLSGSSYRGVCALTFDSSGNLCAGGDFTTSGGTPANYVALWNGSTWAQLGGGGTAEDSPLTFVSSLVCDTKGNLYAGGYFDALGDVACESIAKWDGAAWTPLGSGMNSFVYALALDGRGGLYAGGSFTSAGSKLAHHAAKWDGAAWSLLGNGMNGAVRAIAHDASGNVYAGGDFDAAGTSAANHAAGWDGSSWTALGEGTNDTVCALLCKDGAVYAGGCFTAAGGAAAKHVARWDGNAWSPLAKGTLNPVNALACDTEGILYAAGAFGERMPPPCDLGRWDGTAWTPIDQVDFSYICAMVCDASGNLFAGGYVMVGDIYYSHVAKWNGSAWSSLDKGIHEAYSKISSLAFDDAGGLYAADNIGAGDFRYSRVVKWDGTSWKTLGTEQVAGHVYSLAFDSAGNLLAGGNPVAYGQSHDLVRWNGTSWHSLGAIVDGDVLALDFDASGNLRVGGSFNQIGGIFTPFAACWRHDTSTATFIAGPGGELSRGSTATSDVVVHAVENGADCASVTAVPIGGYEFAYWTGDISSTENPLLLANMTTDVAVTAKFIVSGSEAMRLRKATMSSHHAEKAVKYSLRATDTYEITLDFIPPAGFVPSWLNERTQLSYTFGGVSHGMQLGAGKYKESPQGGRSVITLSEEDYSQKVFKAAVVTVKWDQKSIQLSVKGTHPLNIGTNIVSLFGCDDGKVAGELRNLDVQLGMDMWWDAARDECPLRFTGTKKTKPTKNIWSNTVFWDVKGVTQAY